MITRAKRGPVARGGWTQKMWPSTPVHGENTQSELHIDNQPHDRCTCWMLRLARTDDDT
jgi:hypothetical protein